MDDSDDELIDATDDRIEAAETAVVRVVTVPPALAGTRLDRTLAALIADDGGAPLSRSRLKALLDQGLIHDGVRTLTDASSRVKPGQELTVTVPPAVAALPRPQAIPLTIIFEDHDLLVLDKPAGLVVHPAAGNPDGTLVNALLAYCGDRLSGIGGVRRPGIVHRLDKDTSGLMVVAKTDRAHAGLSAQFADHSLARTYVAVVWGIPQPAQGRIEGNIGRSPANRQKMALLRFGGKPAVTNYTVLRRYAKTAALIECRLETGRTHQIRVHLTAQGHPLIGDPLYGRVGDDRQTAIPLALRARVVGFARQALHAQALRFTHPVTAESMIFSTKLPHDFSQLVSTLELI
ncbi:MAG: RluA family pseudouridine synthase [Azospirillaceae bacterium]|nr:RluA family pseudouridine synthase [Azospirillaceae bacterium]